MAEESDRRQWLQYSMVGKLFILPVLALMGGGWLLDRATGLTPGFTVLGAIVGFFLGLYLLLRVERRLVDDEKKRQQQRKTRTDRGNFDNLPKPPDSSS